MFYTLLLCSIQAHRIGAQCTHKHTTHTTDNPHVHTHTHTHTHTHMHTDLHEKRSILLHTLHLCSIQACWCGGRLVYNMRLIHIEQHKCPHKHTCIPTCMRNAVSCSTLCICAASRPAGVGAPCVKGSRATSAPKQLDAWTRTCVWSA